MMGVGLIAKGKWRRRGLAWRSRPDSFLSVLGGGGMWGEPPVSQGQVILASPPLPSGTTSQLPPVMGTE